jgi:hypothetical protein
MYMPFVAPEDGTLRLKKSEGAVLEPGDLVAMLDLDDPSKVKKAEVFSGLTTVLTILCYFIAIFVDLPFSSPFHNGIAGKLPSFGRPSHGLRSKPNYVIRESISVLRRVLQGYIVPDEKYRNAMDDLCFTLFDKSIAVHDLEEVRKLSLIISLIYVFQCVLCG